MVDGFRDIYPSVTETAEALGEKASPDSIDLFSSGVGFALSALKNLPVISPQPWSYEAKYNIWRTNTYDEFLYLASGEYSETNTDIVVMFNSISWLKFLIYAIDETSPASGNLSDAIERANVAMMSYAACSASVALLKDIARILERRRGYDDTLSSIFLHITYLLKETELEELSPVKDICFVACDMKGNYGGRDEYEDACYLLPLELAKRMYCLVLIVWQTIRDSKGCIQSYQEYLDSGFWEDYQALISGVPPTDVLLGL